MLPFTHMKAQRESGQPFKSAGSKPKRGRAFFHVNEPIDQENLMLAFELPHIPSGHQRGEAYTMIVLRVRGGACHVCQVWTHQSNSRLPSQPHYPVSWSLYAEKPALQTCCLGLELATFAVEPPVCNSHSDKIRHPFALVTQPVIKEDTTCLPFLHMDDGRQRTIFPYL